MHSSNQCVATSFFEFTYRVNPIKLLIHLLHSFNVRVVDTIVYAMTKLFAALTAHVTHFLFSLLRSILRIIRVSFFFF